MSPAGRLRQAVSAGPLLAALLVPGAGAVLGAHAHSFLTQAGIGTAVVSEEWWQSWQPAVQPIPPLMLVLAGAIGASVLWLALSLVLRRRRGLGWSAGLVQAGLPFAWWGLVGLYEVAFALLGSRPGLQPLLQMLVPYVHILAQGGWLAGLASRLDRPPAAAPVPPAGVLAGSRGLWIGMALYTILFSTLAVLQWRALWVPHGDTAMYEEHLWNLIHGKGFMSQLDGGRSFLGEHIEVIHVLLLPIYVLWPHLITLNVLETAALASGALPIAWLARRRLGDPRAATLIGLAYLMYPGLQLLNLELSYKTFRPEAFCVPLLAWAFYAYARHRYVATAVLLALVILCKEELAAVVGMFGLYMTCRQERGPLGRREVPLGLAVTVLSGVYLIVATCWLIPYFRGAAEPHFAGYYRHLGDSFGQVLRNVFLDPGRVLQTLTGVPNEWSWVGRVRFLLALTCPLALAALAGPSRWVLGLPTLAYCLLSNLEITFQLYHFHAPLVPILLLAAVAGIRNLSAEAAAVRRWAWRVVLCAFMGMVVLGKTPASLAFWDPNVSLVSPYAKAGGYWRWAYVPGPRVEAFHRVFPRIPPEASVASTDFLRPRFTHHRLCHDFPLRAHVRPDEIDYFVLDVKELYWLSKDVLDFLGVRPGPWRRELDDAAALDHLRRLSQPGQGLDDWSGWSRLLYLKPPYEPVHFDPYIWVFRRRHTP